MKRHDSVDVPRVAVNPRETNPNMDGPEVTKMAWAYKSSAGKLDVKDGRERDSKDKWKQRYFRVSNQPEPHIWYFKDDKAWQKGKDPLGEMTLENALVEFTPDPTKSGEFLVMIQSAERHLKMRVGAVEAAASWKQTIDQVSGADEVKGVATKLQAVQRGRQERKARVKEGEAAVLIQQIQRGKKARAEVDTMRNRQVLEDFTPTRPLDLRCIDVLTARRDEFLASGKKAPTFEKLALKFPLIAEALTQVKMMFDLDATDPGITVLQISAVLTKLGIEMSEDEIASVFDVPGSGDNAFRDAVAAGGECTEFLTFADFLGFMFVGRSSGALPAMENVDLDGAFDITADLFRLFDESNDGAIVLKEMSKAIKADVETLQERMAEADADGNGFVTFPEFLGGVFAWASE